MFAGSRISQLQVGDNYSYVLNLKSNIKSWPSHITLYKVSLRNCLTVDLSNTYL